MKSYLLLIDSCTDVRHLYIWRAEPLIMYMSSPERTASISNSEYLKEDFGILFVNNMQYYSESQDTLELMKTGNLIHVIVCRAGKGVEDPNGSQWGVPGCLEGSRNAWCGEGRGVPTAQGVPALGPSCPALAMSWKGGERTAERCARCF